jgi:hypothetical protein
MSAIAGTATPDGARDGLLALTPALQKERWAPTINPALAANTATRAAPE